MPEDLTERVSDQACSGETECGGGGGGTTSILVLLHFPWHFCILLTELSIRVVHVEYVQPNPPMKDFYRRVDELTQAALQVRGEVCWSACF